MYESNETLDQLVHLHIDGAFDRRELVRRAIRHCGSFAAAMAALAGFEELRAQTTPCPANVRIPADGPDLEVADVEYSGEGGKMLVTLPIPSASRASSPP